MRDHQRRRLLRLAGISAVPSALQLFGQSSEQLPQTILHIVLIEWHSATSQDQRVAILNGVREMASSIPGINRIWLKPTRLQVSGMEACFAIEFKDQQAVEMYAQHSAHDVWAEQLFQAKKRSLSIQITN